MKRLSLFFRITTFCLVSALGTACISKIEPTLQELEKGEIPERPKVIDIRMSKYRPTPGRQLKEIFVSNFSATVARGKLEESAARDSMPDALKNKVANIYGFDLSGPHSANLMFSDLMLYLSGIQSAQQTFLHCSASLAESTTQDMIKYLDNRVQPAELTYLGLRDCEKSYLGLKPDQFDFDRDLIPDYLELRCGLNPRNPNDAALSPTGDGVTHLEKCKRHIPVDESANSEANKLFGYQYKIENTPNQEKVISVSNIPVLKDNKQNLIVFYLIEIDPSTARTFLFTAYALVTPVASRSNIYEFDYWATSDPNTHKNQEISFP